MQKIDCAVSHSRQHSRTAALDFAAALHPLESTRHTQTYHYPPHHTITSASASTSTPPTAAEATRPCFTTDRRTTTFCFILLCFPTSMIPPSVYSACMLSLTCCFSGWIWTRDDTIHSLDSAYLDGVVTGGGISHYLLHESNQLPPPSPPPADFDT